MSTYKAEKSKMNDEKCIGKPPLALRDTSNNTRERTQKSFRIKGGRKVQNSSKEVIIQSGLGKKMSESRKYSPNKKKSKDKNDNDFV